MLEEIIQLHMSTHKFHNIKEDTVFWSSQQKISNSFQLNPRAAIKNEYRYPILLLLPSMMSLKYVP